jgi:hypothetical protein
MTRRCTPLRICPDCGGILQPVEPERLTSVEVAAGDRQAQGGDGRCQCLICGYLEPVRPAVAPLR